MGLSVGLLWRIDLGRGLRRVVSGTFMCHSGIESRKSHHPYIRGWDLGLSPESYLGKSPLDPPAAPRLNVLAKDGLASPGVVVAPLRLMKDLRSLAGVRGPRPVTIYGAGITLLFAVQQWSA